MTHYIAPNIHHPDSKMYLLNTGALHTLHPTSSSLHTNIPFRLSFYTLTRPLVSSLMTMNGLLPIWVLTSSCRLSFLFIISVYYYFLWQAVQNVLGRSNPHWVMICITLLWEDISQTQPAHIFAIGHVKRFQRFRTQYFPLLSPRNFPKAQIVYQMNVASIQFSSKHSSKWQFFIYISDKIKYFLVF